MRAGRVNSDPYLVMDVDFIEVIFCLLVLFLKQKPLLSCSCLDRDQTILFFLLKINQDYFDNVKLFSL